MTREEQWLLEEKYNGAESEAFRADCLRLQKGEPLAYVIGLVPFLNTHIYLDSHPLIPRPETEHWVAHAIARAKEVHSGKPLRVLDLCAGSGCIGVAVAKAFSNAHVDFAELDEAHHPTIQKNISENGIAENRTTIFGGDLFAQIAGQYDLILSNPPYIPEASSQVAQSVLTHEPHLALFAGGDGLTLIKRIIDGASAHLMPHGLLYLEHEPEQTEAIAAHAKAQGFIVQTHDDQYGVQRFSVLSFKI